MTRQVLHRTAKGSGAALGGGRWEHWRILLVSPSAVEALHELVCRVATGDVPTATAGALALSKLIGLNKPGGGVRPIAAPSLLRRLSGRAFCCACKDNIGSLLGRIQYAVGVPAGTECLAHTARVLSESDPDLVLLALDARNAFCSADRLSCLQKLVAAVPEIAPCATMFSQRRSLYLYWDAKGECHWLYSTDGIDQGDPLAPLLFALGFKPHLEQLESDLRRLAVERGLDPSRIHLLAYLDDVTILVPPEMASEALAAAAAAFQRFGLQLRPDKTQAWSLRAPCPEGLQDQWRRGGLTLVGVPLGEPLPASGLPDPSDDHRVDLGVEDFARDRCCETAVRAAALLAKVAELPTLASPHLPATQLSALLLRMCGAGKLIHLLRSTPPPSVLPAAELYDRAVLDCYRVVADLDALSPQETSQCQLPLRCGGRGLRSQARLAPAAWLASWGQSLSEVLMRTNCEELLDLESCSLPVTQHIREAFEALPLAPASEQDLAADPLAWDNWARHPQKKLQRLLSRRYDENLLSSCLASMDAPSRARLRSCSGPFASAWQWAAPGSPQELLVDDVFVACSRMLLGQPVVPADSICQNVTRTGTNAGIQCGVPLCAQGHHCHRCSRGGGLKARSEDIEQVLAAIHFECGHTVNTQVYVPQWDRWKTHCSRCQVHSVTWSDAEAPCCRCGGPLVVEREEAILDVEVRSSRVPRLFIDVTVHHSVPGDASRLAAAARCGGTVNREAEAEKKRRYPDGLAPWSVIPFAVETYGRLGTAALAHLRSLARARAQGLPDGGGDVAVTALLQRWTARLSAALQRSNSRRLGTSLGTVAHAKRGARELAEGMAG